MKKNIKKIKKDENWTRKQKLKQKRTKHLSKQCLM